MGRDHTFRTALDWTGSTGAGYEAYDRTHRLGAPPAATALTLGADAAFLGDSSLLNPEQLLVAAASSCQLLSFLAVAARARLDVVAYHDDADGVMSEDDRPMWITRIVLRPRITVRGDVTDERIGELCAVAHRACFIANSLRSTVDVEPTFARA